MRYWNQQFLTPTSLLAVLLAGCAAHDASRGAAGSSDGEITTDCPRVLEQSRAAGVDYVPTLRQAARGDDAALSQLFRLTISERLDVDAHQCHIEALAELLRRLGDVRFAAALADEAAETRRAVVSGLILELDSLPSADQSRSAFSDSYPHTAATVAP